MEDNGNANDNDRILAELISLGAEIAFPAGGSAIGAMIGDPIGAAVGSAVGTAVAKAVQLVVGEFANRHLSQRERIRVEEGYRFARNRLSENLKEGRAVRGDGFFDCDVSGRSSAHEILETALIKCKNEPQEKKCKYVAYIFANVAFRPDVSPASAAYLLQIAERLTYRQLCLISLVKRANEVSFRVAWGNLLSSTRRREHPDPSFISELAALSEFIHAMGNTSEPPYLDKLGLLCYEMMSLDEIPMSDLLEIVSLIKGREQ